MHMQVSVLVCLGFLHAHTLHNEHCKRKLSCTSSLILLTHLWYVRSKALVSHGSEGGDEVEDAYCTKCAHLFHYLHVKCADVLRDVADTANRQHIQQLHVRTTKLYDKTQFKCTCEKKQLKFNCGGPFRFKMLLACKHFLPCQRQS